METTTPKKGWLSRNVIWLIPVSVLAVVLVLALSCVGCGTAGFFGVFGLMKSHPAYQEGLALVQENTRAQELLGEPIEAGWFVSGEVSETGATGTAELSVPVSGPKGSGVVYITARKRAGEWVLIEVVLVMDKTKQRVLILAD
ncbi:MAG: cytochrome c oxidase assembly factor 1 family protein [Anaerolineales bacterium]|nr:cytochrome c oxidase assembly factor 1 family protein [Anaerolineales bacterium]